MSPQNYSQNGRRSRTPSISSQGDINHYENGNENTNEMYAGPNSVTIPSSFSSFHHVHRTQSRVSNPSIDSTINEDNIRRLSSSTTRSSRIIERRTSITASVITDDEVELLSRVESRRSRDEGNFRFFTTEEIESAQGTSSNVNVDYDVDYSAYDSDNAGYDGYDGDVNDDDDGELSRTWSSQNQKQGRRYRLIRPSEESKRQSSHQGWFSRERVRSDASSSTPLIYNRLQNDAESISSTSTTGKKAVDCTQGSSYSYFFPQFPSTVKQQRFYLAEEDLVIGIAGFKTNMLRRVLYILLCVSTFGIAYLILRWFPRWRIACMGTPVGFGESDWVVIETEFGDLNIVDVSRKWYNQPLSTVLSTVIDNNKYTSEEPSNDGSTNNGNEAADLDPLLPVLIFIEYRYIKLFYNPLTGLFITNFDWTDPMWQDTILVRNGLDNDTHADRLQVFGSNMINIKEKPIHQLLIDEVLHPFYIFQVFSIILWSLDEYYYYATCIFLISIISVGNTLVETKQTMDRLKEISTFVCDVRVWRNDFWSVVASSDIVPGDIYEVSDPSLNILPCDSVLLSGDCIVNESMLTGESVPVSKIPAEQSTLRKLGSEVLGTSVSADLARSMLYCGTRLVRVRRKNDGPSMALAVRTGFCTTKGALIRSMLFPKPMGFKFYEDSFKYIGFMCIIAFSGFIVSAINFIKLGLGWNIIIFRALDLFTIVVPPALPATLTIGTNFALNRLRKKQIFCISPNRVNVGGKLDILCFDKTGTLTEDGLDVLGVHYIRSDGLFSEIIDTVDSVIDDKSAASLCDLKSQNQRNQARLLATMTTCHTLRVINGEPIGDPLDLKMFEFTKWQYDEEGEVVDTTTVASALDQRMDDNFLPENNDISPAVVRPPSDGSGLDSKNPDNHLGIIRSFEFISELRRMSVLVKSFTGDDIHAYVKGAPEVMPEICKPESLPSNYEELLHEYTHHGYRVIACATKTIRNTSWVRAQKLTRQKVESELELVGLIVFENKLKPTSASVIDQLNEAEIRTVMCTGDNILTAVSVGKECGIIPTDHSVFVPRFERTIFDEYTFRLMWENLDDPTSLLDPVTLQPNKAIGKHVVAVSGEVFRYVLTELQEPRAIEQMLIKGAIFARMSPDEKHELIEQLKKLDYTTGFCGDGANDCAALKAADVGISLSEAEASVAAPFTSRIFEISCVLDVIREGRASLVTSFSCFKYMSLYSAIQFVTVTILYRGGSNLGDFQFLWIDLFLIIPIAIFMGWSKPFPKLTRKRPTANLVSPKVLITLLLQIIVFAFFQIFSWILVKREPWYIKPVPGGDDEVESSDNSVLFSVSNFQYILIGIVLTVGPPYREPIIKNIPFLITIAITLTGSLLIMTFPSDSYLGHLLQMTDIPFYFQCIILLIVFSNFFVSWLGEKFTFIWIAHLYKRLSCLLWRATDSQGKAVSKKLFKRLKSENNLDSSMASYV